MSQRADTRVKKAQGMYLIPKEWERSDMWLKQINVFHKENQYGGGIFTRAPYREF